LNPLSTDSPTGVETASAAGSSLLTVFLEVARCCGARLLADMVGIFEPVDDGQSLRTQIASPGASESKPPAVTIIPAYGTLAAHALGTGNVSMSPDLAADRRFEDGFLVERGARSGVVLPVWLEDQPVCLLGIFRFAPHDFLLDELCYLERVGDALAHLAGVSGWRGSTDASVFPVSKADGQRMLNVVQGQLAAAELNEREIEAILTGRRGPECRVSQRHEYPYSQAVAPIRGDRLPDLQDFVEVRCGDLSGGGISLWMDKQPDFRELVVALGRAPSVVHFAARVVYVRESRQGGHKAFHVGCQFLRRVYL
jgi:hypothetical protein